MSRILLNCFVVAVVISNSAHLIKAQADPQLIEKLINVTSSEHPFRRDLPDWIKPPVPDPGTVSARLDPILAENTQLTDNQKQFIKANYHRLAILMNDKALVALNKHLNFSDWLTAYLTETYRKELTTGEMGEWIAYFETAEGKLVLKAILAYPQPTDPENQALLGKFEKTLLGAKFIKIFGDDLDKVIQTRLDEVEAAAKEELERVFSPAEMNRLFSQFLAENYNKP